MSLCVCAGSMFCLQSKQWHTDNWKNRPSHKREKERVCVTNEMRQNKRMCGENLNKKMCEKERKKERALWSEVHLNRHVEETSLIRLYILL